MSPRPTSPTPTSATARPARPGQPPRPARPARRGPAPDPFLQLQASLTRRDLTVLAWLADHGVLTTPQLAWALFPSPDFAQRRLHTLHQLGLLERFRPLRMNGGSYAYHYVLADLGAQVMAAQRHETPPRPAQTRARMHALTHRANLPHLLGTNQFFTDLAGYAHRHPDTELQRWWPTSRCVDRGAFLGQTIDPTLLLFRMPVHPDGFGVLTLQPQGPGPEPDAGGGTDPRGQSRSVAFFLEHDTGTEPVPTLVAKAHAYAEVTRQTGRRWPVLFDLHSAVRERHLHQQLAAAHPGSGALPDVATLARDRRNGRNPAENLWWLHHGDTNVRLADLPSSPPITPASDSTYGSLPSHWYPRRPPSSPPAKSST